MSPRRRASSNSALAEDGCHFPATTRWFAALGGKPGEMDARGRLIYAYEGGRLMITKPMDGKPATVANGGTIGIAAASQSMF